MRPLRGRSLRRALQVKPGVRQTWKVAEMNTIPRLLFAPLLLVGGCAHGAFLMRDAETPAIVHLRVFITYEAAYSSQNGGFFDNPGCLQEPAKCVPDFPSDVPWPFSKDVALPPPGYQVTFFPGPTAPKVQGGRTSESSILSFSILLEPTQSGRRWLCGDSRGTLCYSETAIKGAEVGTCPSSCRTIS